MRRARVDVAHGLARVRSAEGARCGRWAAVEAQSTESEPAPPPSRRGARRDRARELRAETPTRREAASARLGRHALRSAPPPSRIDSIVIAAASRRPLAGRHLAIVPLSHHAIERERRVGLRAGDGRAVGACRGEVAVLARRQRVEDELAAEPRGRSPLIRRSRRRRRRRPSLLEWSRHRRQAPPRGHRWRGASPEGCRYPMRRPEPPRVRIRGSRVHHQAVPEAEGRRWWDGSPGRLRWELHCFSMEPM